MFMHQFLNTFDDASKIDLDLKISANSGSFLYNSKTRVIHKNDPTKY